MVIHPDPRRKDHEKEQRIRDSTALALPGHEITCWASVLPSTIVAVKKVSA